MEEFSMTLHELTFSNNPRLRLIRHASFWILFGLMYYVQSIVPVEHALFVALASLVCFLPACVISVYFFLHFLLPLAKHKKYVLFTFVVILFAVGIVIFNYFESMLFFLFTCDCDVWGVDRAKFVALDLNNSFHAITTAGLVLGFRVTKDWIVYQKVNRDLYRQKIDNEVKLQRTKMHPPFLLRSLHQLRTKIDGGSGDAPDIILKLSDVLSYILYDASEEKILLSHEIAIVRKLLELEQINMGEDSFSLDVTGNVDDKESKPLVVVSAIWACLDLFRDHLSPIAIAFKLSVRNTQSVRLIASIQGLHSGFDGAKWTHGFAAMKNGAGSIINGRVEEGENDLIHLDIALS